MFETYKPTISTYSSSEIHTRNARKGFAFRFRMEMRALRIKHGRKKYPEYTDRTESNQKTEKHKNCYGFIRDTNENNDEQVFLVVTKLKTD